MSEQTIKTKESESPEWLPIPSTGGKYLASSKGEIRHHKRRKPMKVYRNAPGSISVTLTLENSEQVSRSPARLIWEAFYGPVPDGLQVTPINRDYTDCRPENLRLKNPGLERLLSPSDVRAIFQRADAGETHAKIAEDYDVSQAMVSGVLNRSTYQDVDITDLADYTPRNPRKLDQADVDDIRMWAKAGICQAEMAREYNVSEAMISRIVNGSRWVEENKEHG